MQSCHSALSMKADAIKSGVALLAERRRTRVLHVRVCEVNSSSDMKLGVLFQVISNRMSLCPLRRFTTGGSYPFLLSPILLNLLTRISQPCYSRRIGLRAS